MTDSITDAIAEAVAEKGAAVLEADDAADDGATPAVGEPSKGEQPSTEATKTEPVDDGEAVAEVPEEYWGVALDGIAPEKRAEIIAHFEQQDSTIHKLQESLAKEPEAPAVPVPDAAADEDISDTDLLTAAGYDPEDYEVQQMAKFILPSLRRELALEDQLAELVQDKQVNAVATQWNTQLNELEEMYGKLPGTREQVLRKAAEEGIVSPEVLYFRLSAPIKREVETAVANARREAAKLAEQGTLRPGTSTAGEPPVTPEMSLREAVAAAAKSAEKESGVTWKSIMRGRMRDE